MTDLEDRYNEAREIIERGDAEEFAAFLARDLTPVDAATISAALHNPKIEDPSA